MIFIRNTMKKIALICFSQALLFACANPDSQLKNAPVPDKVKMAEQTGIKLPAGMLASPNDTICGMSLHDEPADTLNVGDKVYGFCSTECKTAFAAQLAKK
ncbi:MAG: hypothetical protein U0X76_06775 [Bacteroidia bacterium]